MHVEHDRITATIERKWLAEIIAGSKTTEYRRIKPCWTRRFKYLKKRFELRLINGMPKPIPEVTVLIDGIQRNHRTREYGLIQALG